MQSNQSKLLIAGLVAAQAASALEIQESTQLVETHEDQIKTILAQAQVDPEPEPIDEAELEAGNVEAPENENPNTEEEEKKEAEEAEKEAEDKELDEKIHILTDSAIGGLDAKKEWILEKLTMYSKQKLAELNAIDEKCRA